MHFKDAQHFAIGPFTYMAHLQATFDHRNEFGTVGA